MIWFFLPWSIWEPGPANLASRRLTVYQTGSQLAHKWLTPDGLGQGHHYYHRHWCRSLRRHYHCHSQTRSQMGQVIDPGWHELEWFGTLPPYSVRKCYSQRQQTLLHIFIFRSSSSSPRLYPVDGPTQMINWFVIFSNYIPIQGEICYTLPFWFSGWVNGWLG